MKEKDVAVIGYENSIALWIHHSEEAWSRFNLMVTINSIIIGAYMVITSGNQNLQNIKTIAFILIMLCLILNVLWLILAIRSVILSDYYIFSAREIEEKYFSKNIDVIKRGGDLINGNEIKFNISQFKKKLSFPKIIQYIPSRIIVYVMISLFLFLDVLLLFNYFLY